MPQHGASPVTPATCGPLPAAQRRAVALRWYPASHPTAEIERVVVILAVAGALALVLLPLDVLSDAAGECTFHTLTGIPCATCGITRGIVDLGHARMLRALRMNPLLIGGLLLGAAYTPFAALAWWRGWRRPRLCLVTAGARWGAALVFLVLALANWAFLIADGR
ncbi:MAG: DUF2752 domain-containing protein [Acidobacteria bacterium]|nr:DUF2752 domain-containing protein [Acidobacteriota bacterium]